MRRRPFRIGALPRIPRSSQERVQLAKLVNTKISLEDESYFTELLNAELVVGWGLTPALMELLDRHRRGEGNYGSHLSTVLAVQIWQDLFRPQPSPTRRIRSSS